MDPGPCNVSPLPAGTLPCFASRGSGGDTAGGEGHGSHTRDSGSRSLQTCTPPSTHPVPAGQATGGTRWPAAYPSTSLRWYCSRVPPRRQFPTISRSSPRSLGSTCPRGSTAPLTAIPTCILLSSLYCSVANPASLQSSLMVYNHVH